MVEKENLEWLSPNTWTAGGNLFWSCSRIVSTNALGENSPALKDPTASLLPGVQNLRDVAREIAFAVGSAAQEADLAPRLEETEFRSRVTESQWMPEYLPYEA